MLLTGFFLMIMGAVLKKRIGFWSSLLHFAGALSIAAYFVGENDNGYAWAVFAIGVIWLIVDSVRYRRAKDASSGKS